HDFPGVPWNSGLACFHDGCHVRGPLAEKEHGQRHRESMRTIGDASSCGSLSRGLFSHGVSFGRIGGFRMHFLRYLSVVLVAAVPAAALRSEPPAEPLPGLLIVYT